MTRLLIFIGVPWGAWLAAIMSLVIAASDQCEGEAEFPGLSRRRSPPSAEPSERDVRPSEPAAGDRIPGRDIERDEG